MRAALDSRVPSRFAAVEIFFWWSSISCVW